jgi:hypothetical protein
VDPAPTQAEWTVDTLAPTTTISQQPTSPSTSSSATFQFASNEPTGATFQCSLDGAPAAGCTSPQTYNNLTNGSHTFSVYAVDQATNPDATPATASWTVNAAPPDTTPPDTTITSGPGGLNNIAQPSVEFTSTEAGSTFQCAVNGGLFAACSSPNILGALVDGAITFDVRAIDPAGNVDPTPALLSWTRDTAPPAAPATSVGPRSKSPFQTTTNLRAEWDVVPGAASYDTEQRITAAGSDWTSGAWKALRTNATETGAGAPVGAGRAACFRARSTDAAGNDSAFGTACTAVPYKAPKPKNGYLRLQLTPAGKAAAVRRVALVATKCPQCGKVRVVVTSDSKPPIAAGQIATSKTLNLKASSTQKGRLITVTTYPSASPTLKRRFVYVFGAGGRGIKSVTGIGVSPY